MVFVRHGTVTAVWAVFVLARMRGAVMHAAIRSNNITLRKDVLVDVIAVNVVQVSVVQVVGVRVVLDRGMAATLAMYVGVAVVRLMHGRPFAQAVADSAPKNRFLA